MIAELGKSSGFYLRERLKRLFVTERCGYVMQSPQSVHYRFSLISIIKMNVSCRSVHN